MTRFIAGSIGRLSLGLAAFFFSAAACAVDVQVSGFTDSPDPAVRGGNITYTITVQNSDADTANNVVVSYPLPASSQFVSANDPARPGACTFDGTTLPGTVTCTYPTLLGTLASPTPGPIETITVIVKTTGSSVTTLDSTVTVSTTDADTNPTNNTLSQNTTVNDGADLSATMSGAPNPATGGANVTWTITGSNLGPNTSGPVTYTTTLPGVLTYVPAGSGGGGWTCGASGQVVTCTLAARAIGAYPNLPIVTKVTGSGGGTITVSGNITSTVGDPDLSNNSPVASVTVNPGADLAVTQNTPSPSPAISGSTVTFSLSPTNLGPYAATAGANVTFPLPAGFAVTSANGTAGWTCVSSGSPATVTCTFAGSYASGAGGTLTIVATTPTVGAPTAYNNITATIAPNPGGPADPNSSNNTSAKNLTVSPDGLDLSVAKSKAVDPAAGGPTPTVVAVGGTMTSTIVVNNAGPRTAATGTITVVDALDPTKEQYSSFSGTSWTCVSTAPNVTCTYNAALPVGNASTLKIVTVALASGTIANNATASYSGTPGDYNSTNNTIGASVTATDVSSSPDLQVALAATTAGGVQTTVEVNETQITYTLGLTNSNLSSVNAQNVVVTLNIPGRVSATPSITVGQVLTNTSGTSTATFTCAGTGTGNSGNIVCTQTGGTLLSPGDVMTFTAVVNRPLVDVSNLNATASALSTSQGDTNLANNSVSVPITIAPIADVEVVSKVLAANPVLAGTNATYTITVKNDGPSSAAAGVSLADVFTIPGGDSGFTFISATASNGGTCAGLTPNTSYTSGTPTETCSWGLPISNTATRTVTIVVRPNWQAGAGARTLANTATVSSPTPEDSVGGTGTFGNSKSLTLNINPAQVDVLINNADLVDPIGYDPSTPANNDISYAVVETNNGVSLATSTGFTYTMTPPSGKTITFRGDGAGSGTAAANPSGTIPGSICDSVGSSITGPATLTVTCLYAAPGFLASGATQTRYLVFRVGTAPSVGGDTYTTNATVIVNETDTNPSNNTEGETTSVRVRADISVVKTASVNPAQIRQPFNWTVVVNNAGPGDSQTTGLTDTLPSGTVFSGATPSWTSTSGGSGTCTVVGLSLTCAFGTLPANQSVNVTIPVKVTTYPSGGTTTNCATATTSEVDPNSANNLSVCGTVAVQNSSLAGTVFQDSDRNGGNAGTPQSAATEPRIAGVTVVLTGTDAYGNAVSMTRTTDVNGAFGFSNLSPAGASGYTLTETQPTAYVNGPASPPAPAAGGTYAAGGSTGNSTYTGITLAGNTVGIGYDFPEVRKPSLSGFVYIDSNANGTRDAGTDGVVSGATVRLLNAGTLAVVATTTTGGTGAYTFSGLDPLTVYTLEEPLPSSPAGLGNGAVNPGLVNGAACASGCTAQPNTPAAGTDRIAGIDLGAGTDGTFFNFGELLQTSVSGLVFIDANRNNLLDGSDTGRIAGVTVRLVQGANCTSGTTLQTTTSAADGTYSFANVLALQGYLVCETQPAGYGNGVELPGTNGATTPGSDVIAFTNLSASGSTGNNFGERVAQIAGSVYQDTGAGTPANFDNGLRDSGELGIANVPVTLSGVDQFGTPVSRTVNTDASGNYGFDGLFPPNGGGYMLTEGAIPVASGIYLQGKDASGTGGGSIAVQDVTSGIVLSAGQQATGYLFGELPIAPIAGTVYLDSNRNGTMEATPTDGRIAGVTLTLRSGSTCAGAVLATTTSDASGNYGFSGTAAGSTVTICETQPAGYADGSVNPGASATSSAGNAITIVGLPAAGSTGNLFGERAGSIAGNVFLDANDDGLRTGDVGIAGVTVTLTGTDASGTAVSRTATTDTTGAYRFDAVLGAGAGGYTLTEQTAQPAVGGKTTLNGKTTAGSSGGTATAVATTPSAVASIALTAGVDATENNFAEILPVSLAGVVFVDLNDNGVQNLPGDAGIANVAIVVTGTDDTGAAVTRNVTTGADGSYALTDLRPGTYTVTEPTQPVGTSNGRTITGSAGGTATAPAVTPSAIAGIVLTTPGSAGTAYDFAELANTSAVSGRVWLDADNNGLVNGTETGIAGVTITLTGTDLGGNAVSRTTTTDASGNYSVAGLAPGTYTLTEPTQPAGTLNGKTVAGSTGGTPTTVATTPSAITGIVVGAGQSAVANNFGELPPASVAGHVISDSNNNGRQDAGESGIGNVGLVLTGTDDLGNAVDASTTSDANGAYAFANLRPGSYTVTEPTQPPATDNGITTAGSVNGTGTGTATSPATLPSAISSIALPVGGASIGNDFAEIGSSPDVLVTKAAVEARFTVDNVGTYTIGVRNGGEVATSAAYRVSDRLPPGLTLNAVPSGTGWTCVGAIGASSFTCTSSDVMPPGASNPNAITVKVQVAAAAAQSSPAINAVTVDGGGELPARAPTAAELDGFNNTPANLPACAAGITQNACRTSTVVQASASLSGTVWYDIGSARNALDGGDRRLAGWQVEVLDANGNIVARATTAADGTYRIAALLPGVVLHVRFRDPASTIVWGYPVNGEAAPGSSGASCSTQQAIANGTASSCAGTGSDPTLTVVLAAGANLPQQSLPVDPSGVIYDSGTRQPVPGAVVTLTPSGTCAGFDPATSLVASPLGGYTVNGSAVSMTVGADGFYQFLLAPSAPASCTFALTVAPPAGYSFVSVLIPPAAGPYVPAGAPGSSSAVQPQAGAPTGAVGPATTYYLTLTAGSGTANVVNNHIPLDPSAAAGLGLSKTGDRNVASIGDSVRYTVTVSRASGAAPRQVSIVDRLPAGFTFIAGTAVLDGVTVADPVGKPGPVLTFNLGAMPTTGQLVLQYRVRVGVGAQQGDGTNRAVGYGCGVPAGCTASNGTTPLPGSTATNEARFKVTVSGGVFTTDACFAGKIFVDCNGNSIQDPEEIGIPGVRLVVSDGTTLVSDSEGKYSYCGMAPRSAVIRVDETTLPRGSRLTTSSNRNLGDAGSLWLDLKNGELARADFIEGSCSANVMSQVKARRAQGEIRSVETEKQSLPALTFDSKDKGPKVRTDPPAGPQTGGTP